MRICVARIFMSYRQQRLIEIFVTFCVFFIGRQLYIYITYIGNKISEISTKPWYHTLYNRYNNRQLLRTSCSSQLLSSASVTTNILYTVAQLKFTASNLFTHMNPNISFCVNSQLTVILNSLLQQLVMFRSTLLVPSLDFKQVIHIFFTVLRGKI